MINIASIPPASWPTSATAATAVAPVAAVGAVSPSSRSGREDASAFGSGSGRQAPLAQDASAGKGVNREASADAPKAAPILPEKAKAGESSSVAQALEEAKEAEKAAQEAEAVQAERATQRERLLEVLSTVWKASAAVVDNALGRRDQVGAPAASAREAGAGAAPVVVAAAVRSGAETQDQLAGSVPPELAQADGSAPVFLPTEPPVSYTEHGVSQWGSLELGQLVSKRA